MVFIDGTHIKASANKKKYQKEQVAKAARVYAKRLREEVNEERAKLGKPPVEEDDEDDNNHPDGGMSEQTVSTTDLECGMYHKGEHEKQFAYEAQSSGIPPPTKRVNGSTAVPRKSTEAVRAGSSAERTPRDGM